MAFMSTFLVATGRSSSLPPGPPTIPFVGNLTLDMSDILKLFRDLRKKYGDVFSLILGKRTLIVVCGIDKIREVLVKHADITSDRPVAFLFKELGQHTGPRICTGESLARMKLFIFSTNLLQSYELLPETSETFPSFAFTLGVTRAPKPYLIRATPV